ncbi:MAG: selenocysteine-specific translation elongation factor [Burkholderiales bacterium]
MIIATAGHVDHGKTSLVGALTGEDTDRLPEEKRRGMSIDLGFAYLPQPGGEPIAFVDVPGHERFVRNMTAGVQGVDLALLVVAADDGPMPQTREHLNIVDRLGAPRLLAVLTKIDRVSEERAAEARAETQALLAGSRFAGADILAVSSATGAGLDALRARLAAEAATPAPRQAGTRFRMNVDRAFVIDGLGLVATGTVISGTIAAGDEVRLLPRGRSARVRSLRANHGEAMRASAGQRCALALQGLARGDVERGDIVSDTAPAPRSRHVDVTLESLAGAGNALSRRSQVAVHLGTALLAAQLSPFVHGERRFARLAFPHEVSAWHGDRFLVRDPGSRRLLAAGSVVDPLPPERGAAKPQRLALLERIAERNADEAFAALLEGEPGMVDTAWFACCWHLSAAELARVEAAHALAAFQVRKQRHVMRAPRWQAMCEALEHAVADWHAAHPDSIGPRPAEVGHAGSPVIDFLVDAARLRREGPHLRLPTHRPTLSAQDEALWQKVAPLLEGEGGRPPRVHELASLLAMESKAVSDFLQRAARAGRVHAVASNRYFLPGTLQALVDLAAALDAESGGSGFGAALYRDRSGLGRNLTIQVLEFLDASGYTRRVGEVRRMRKS